MKTKILITAILVGIISLQGLNAQEEKKMQYLFGGENGVSISGFGAPIMEFTSINQEFAFFMGGGGAVLFNQKFYIGGYGMGLTTGHYRPDLANVTGIDIPNPKIAFGHGGFWLGYIHESYKAIHFGASARVGWGQISVYDPYFYYDSQDYRASDGVFVATPQLEIEMNLTPWFKVNVAGGYRLVTGIDKTYADDSGILHQYYDASDYNSPQGTITLLFGGFGTK